MKLKDFTLDLKKSWQWMVYIYLALPLLMFLLAWFMGDNDMGSFFSGLFHAYNLYIMDPLFNWSSKIGIIGIVIPLFLFGWALKRKDFLDLAICIGIEALVVVYFLMEWNYLLIQPLRF